MPALAPGEVLYNPPALLPCSHPFGGYGAPCPCSFLLRRWAFEQIGGFDERFNPSSFQLYEDVAFLSKAYLHLPIFVSGACLDKNRCNRFSMTRQPRAAKTRTGCAAILLSVVDRLPPTEFRSRPNDLAGSAERILVLRVAATGGVFPAARTEQVKAGIRQSLSLPVAHPQLRMLRFQHLIVLKCVWLGGFQCMRL